MYRTVCRSRASGKACESLQVFCVFADWQFGHDGDSFLSSCPTQLTMAAGSRKKYALDLNDIFAFPDGDNIPLRPPNTEEGESWVMLLELRRSVVRGFKRYTLTLW